MSEDPVPDPPQSADERVVIRPSPGGRRAQPAGATASGLPTPPDFVAPPASARSAGAPATSTRPPTAAFTDETAGIAPLGGPIATAAGPLLVLLAGLRNTALQPDPADLYRRAMTALGDFGRQAGSAGVSIEQVRLAHYALCASIDDAVLHTPWGASSKWSNRPLTVALHRDTGYDSHFFDELARLCLDAAKNLALIEVFYLCLALGFIGKYRHLPAGRDELDQLRAKTCALILKQKQMDLAGAKDLQLSGRWLGVQAPYRPAATALPAWVVHAAALAMCGAMFLWVSTALNAASDEHFARALSAPPSRMPEIQRADPTQSPPAPEIAPSETGILERIRDRLSPDIASGWVTVAGSPATPLVRVHVSNGFTTGGATPSPAFVSVMGRIGASLRDEPGTVQVIAYTDNQTIKTVRFPSNFALSDARARAARDAIARTIGDPTRLSAEGRAGADPIATNASADGREQNRRIEVILHRPE